MKPGQVSQGTTSSGNVIELFLNESGNYLVFVYPDSETKLSAELIYSGDSLRRALDEYKDGILYH
jgi:hypothetical protein